jgi:hypothetical protein
LNPAKRAAIGLATSSE